MNDNEQKHDISILSINDLLNNRKLATKPLSKTKNVRSKKSVGEDVEINEIPISSFKISNRIAANANKTKKEKKVNSKNFDIMCKHEEKMNYFQSLYQIELPNLKEELKKFEIVAPDDITTIQEKNKIIKKIKEIENKTEEIDYMIKTSKLLVEYNRITNLAGDAHLQKDTSGKLTQHINKYDNIEKQRLEEEYCRIMNNGLMMNLEVLYFDNDKCVECDGITRSYNGYISCTECGLVSDNTIPDYQHSYKAYQDTTYHSTFSYKRANRFKEILSTMQAKENTDIPQNIIKAIENEIEKEGLEDLNKLNKSKIKTYLKKLSLTQYYDHIPSILNKINGIPAIEIPQDIQDKFLEMFNSIQKPYDEVKSIVCPTRQSFLSYNFVFYKFCELLNLSEYQCHFTLLKSIDKLRVQDKIWKGICEKLNWEYIRSI